MTGARPGGFFVDIGAFDGVDISNTWLLEKALAWRGLCIEPNPDVFRDLVQNRQVRCIERAVASGAERTLPFVPAGVLGALAGYENSDHHSATRARLADADKLIHVRTIAPDDLLAHNDAPNLIDFVSIDTEGAEWDIVSAWDHERWRVALFAIEHNHVPGPRARIRGFLEQRGYQCVPAGHDDWFWHAGHLDTLNHGVAIDYARINEAFTRP